MRSSRTTLRALAVTAAIALGLAACSDSGGAAEEESGSSNLSAGTSADTPSYKVAMITHEAPGDTFWDLIRAGAETAAEKDNIELVYSNSPEAPEQASLIQNAIDQDVDAIASTMPNVEAIGPALQQAVDAGIPVVMFNAGITDWQDTGALMYFGQDETVAGEAAGARLSEDGYQKVLCVVQEQGQVQLEARCDGVAKGFSGTTEKLYVNGRDLTAVTSSIQGKLQQDSSIDAVITLGAPIALAAVQSIDQSGSSAELVTFDTNADLVQAVVDGDVQWAIDQQPFLQGYESVDSLWLYLTNANIIGGGQAVFTGPSFIDASNIDQIAEYAERGTR